MEIYKDEIDSMNLMLKKVSVKGVSDAMEKHKDKDSKGIKAHFRMDESGLLHLDRVEISYEYKVEEQVADTGKSNVVGEAFAKFGQTISQLFGRSKEEGEPAGGAETSEPAENATDTTNATKANETIPSVDEKVNNTVNGTNMRTEVRIKMVKEVLSTDVEITDIPEQTAEEILVSEAKLKELNIKESEKLARDKIKNNLESFIHETKMKLFEKEYEDAVSEEEREKIQKDLSAASEWLEYESDAAETSVFRDKLTDLRATTRDMFDRVKEHRERPEALKTLTEMLNISSLFLNGAKNVSKEDQIFTEVELKTLDDLVTTTQKWMDESIAEQKKLPLNQTPKLLVKHIAEKIGLLDREIKYLINKAKFTPPKRKETKSEDATSETPEESKESSSGDEAETTENAEASEEDLKKSTESEAESETPKPTKVNEDPHSEL
ncbi:hypothetical protein B4U80_06504 [Leptotrombidium deliense]|uniref:Hypoxia up-regulated protein 1 n=1 Tax=Leptotrombidium deliense TaxID=299467 RepID=A0A443S397_9ACAR|nr:hypothetical protein B4U80_06504 [Leptotrombidium deliense]